MKHHWILRHPIVLATILVIVYFAASLFLNLKSRPHGQPRKHFAHASITDILTGLHCFKKDTGRFPTMKEGLYALATNSGIIHWNGPYLRPVVPDPWNTPFRYRLMNGDPVVDSAGPDKEFDTSDDIKN